MLLWNVVTFLAYLDEFGHISPYVAQSDRKHNDSPVFGLAGLVLPATEVRGFGTWFFKRKAELLAFEIQRSGKHPAVWEKKGSTLYTVTNIGRYRELRTFTSRFFNKIKSIGGFVFYVGIKKTHSPGRHNPNRLYAMVLVEAIKRLNEFCDEDIQRSNNLLLVSDKHHQRSALITEASWSNGKAWGCSCATPERRSTTTLANAFCEARSSLATPVSDRAGRKQRA